MVYRVIVPPHVEKQISQFHPLLKTRIRAALDELAKSPFEGKALKENLKGFYSFRVNRYRIIYSIQRQNSKVQVVAIGHRETIYSTN